MTLLAIRYHASCSLVLGLSFNFKDSIAKYADSTVHIDSFGFRCSKENQFVFCISCKI